MGDWVGEHGNAFERQPIEVGSGQDKAGPINLDAGQYTSGKCQAQLKEARLFRLTPIPRESRTPLFCDLYLSNRAAGVRPQEGWSLNIILLWHFTQWDCSRTYNHGSD